MAVLGTPDKERDVPEVKVDKVLGLVRHKAAKALADDDVPRRPEALVDGALDVRGHVLLNCKLDERIAGDLDDCLLHVRLHVDILDDCRRRRVRSHGIDGIT